jgi:prolyl oligopeptidase
MTQDEHLNDEHPTSLSRSFQRSLIVFFLLGAALVPAARAQQPMEGPPPTRTDSVKETIHGVEITDPYRWLEDQTSPETRAWIDAQNRYTEAALGKLPGRDAIAKRLSELLKVDSVQLPTEKNGRYFFQKRAADQDLSLIYMRRGPQAADEVLVDPQPLSPDHSTSVNLEGVSPDGRLMAYAIRKGGEDETTIHVMDADTRKDLPDQLPHAYYLGIALKPDNSGLYYSRMTPDGPRIYYHALGTDAAGDVEIWGKGYGKEMILYVDLSDDGGTLILGAIQGSGTTKSELYIQDLRAHGPIVPVVNDLDSLFFAQATSDTLYMWTNWKAPMWRVFAVDLKKPARDRWREIIPETDARLEGIVLAGGKLFADYTRSAVSQLKIFEPTGKPAGAVELPGLGTVSGFTGRWGSREVFFSFESFAAPFAVYRFDVEKGSREVWARSHVQFDGSAFEVKQVWYESKDKTRIPMFLFHKKGIKLDGSHPTLLTGYGGFDVSETPSFSAEAAVWVERGGIYAKANMRGGGEFGEAWHHAGMLGNKQNVFDDFIAAGEWLVASGYTKPARLAIIGTSNGGLLMGAALTQRPDLFGAVVCRYPLLDMLRFQKFLVAQWWVPEYGSSDDAGQFPYLYAYSPYHHVVPGAKYPAVLFVTGDGDTRVAPLHARKMAARLQAATSSGRSVLLLYDTKSGHSGGRPVGKIVEEQTNELSFLYWQLGAGPE